MHPIRKKELEQSLFEALSKEVPGSRTSDGSYTAEMLIDQQSASHLLNAIIQIVEAVLEDREKAT